MTIPCPLLDNPYPNSGSADLNEQVADLLDHWADKHCPDPIGDAVLRDLALKMRDARPTVTGSGDPTDAVSL